MMGLLVFKEGLKAFYAKYSAFAIPVIRFAVGFTAVFLMNQNVGFMPKGWVLYARAFLTGRSRFCAAAFCWRSSRRLPWR